VAVGPADTVIVRLGLVVGQGLLVGPAVVRLGLVV
jgi:hypothetical protein